MEDKKVDYNFNEKIKEYDSLTKKELPVWQSPKYKDSKEKVIEMIESGKYNLKESDFWILMNKTSKGDKMAYTGLIISHNGCLKINDSLENSLKFKPSCVKENKDGYENSLVYTYCNDEQGIYEVGEISQSNYKQSKGRYPYAMAYKRLFDRVVLKNSKLAYSGVYSDSEADEFKDKIEEKDYDKLPKHITDFGSEYIEDEQLTKEQIEHNEKEKEILELLKETGINMAVLLNHFKKNIKEFTDDDFKKAKIVLEKKRDELNEK